MFRKAKRCLSMHCGNTYAVYNTNFFMSSAKEMQVKKMEKEKAVK